MLSDCIELSSAEARVEGIVGGSVGVSEGIPIGSYSQTRTEPKSASIRLMVSHD